MGKSHIIDFVLEFAGQRTITKENDTIIPIEGVQCGAHKASIETETYNNNVLNIKVLEKRLEKRGYGKEKIRENLDVEIFDTCLTEANEAGHDVVVVDTTKGYKITQVVKELK